VIFSLFREQELTDKIVKILTQETDKDVIESNKSDKERKLLPKLNNEVNLSRITQKTS
jgi:hypothetical protein